jgi:putative membrane protein insertion efficiency factor
MPSADLSLAQRGALRLLRMYKILVSPMFAGSCRFLPSCSDYAAEAVTRFGVARGSVLAAWRLARCHPLGAHGVDPVPLDVTLGCRGKSH